MNTTKTWKRVLAILMAFLIAMSTPPVVNWMGVDTYAANATTVYMKPNSDWLKDGARFAAYFFQDGKTEKWVSMTDSDGDGIYEAAVPSGYNNVIFCRMNGSATANNWNNKWNQTGDLTVPTGNNILYTISGWSTGSWGKMSFGVTFSLTDVTKSSGNSTATYGTNYTATLVANTGYSLPSAIVIKAGSTTLTSGTHYTYDSSTGKITINGSAINGKITITATGASAVYNVTYSLSNVTKSSGNDTVTAGSDYTATLAATSGYHLPKEITVTVGSNTLVAGTGYTYYSSTGVVTVNAAYVTGDINISATGEKDYYIVVGEASLTGSDWSTTDINNLMTENGDGTLTLNYSNVAAGTYQIKVVKNGAYENGQWPQSGNHSFTVKENSNITVKLDLNTHTLSVEIFSLVTHVGVTFTGTHVTSNGAAGANDEADYTATLSAATGYRLPETITVSIGGTVIDASAYSYDSSTGVLTIPKELITGAIEITAVGEDSLFVIAGSEGLTGSDWNTTDSNNKMTKNDNGIYTIVYNNIPAGSYEFKVVENGQWRWPDENYELNLTSNSIIEITYDPIAGTGTVLVKKAMDANSIFYVTTDIVDYINDNRISAGQINGYYTDNQGIWNTPGDSPYSYLNDLISQQAYYGHYTYPLYFGPLNFIESRYSRVVNSTTKYPLGRWSSAANTAMAKLNNNGSLNTDAVVQGLVGSKLSEDGNMVDPVTGTTLLYFNKEAADSWTNQGGIYPVMTYYSDLQFPFKVSYDENTRVTTYSYDSAKDYAVYYDYTNKQLYTSDVHVLDSSYDGDNSETDYGFYPLNRPGDSENETNNGFGVKFSIDFTVGDDGLLANGEPVTFDFTGDDDLWVFIDGVLVLDMGGAHAKASGSINFADLTATVNDAYTISSSSILTTGDSNLLSSYQGHGLPNWIYNNSEERATVTTAASTKSFKDLGLTDFQRSGVHTMTVFYMERGMTESNFSMEFTMVPVPSGLTISKELNDADINNGLLNAIGSVSDYDFTLSATSPSSTTSVAFSSYSLTEKFTGMITTKTPNGSINGKTYTALISGITDFTYAHSFYAPTGEDAFIPGTHFKIEETTKGIFNYTATKWRVYDAKNGYDIKFQGDNSTIAEFNMGEIDDTVSCNYAVTFINTMALGNLQIVKVCDDPILANTQFKFKVYLDLDGNGETFSKSTYDGLVYTVDGQEYTVEESTVVLKGGQTAVIAGIPAGATYWVEEIMEEDAPWTMTSENTSGTITADKTSTATFINTVKSNSQDKVIYVEAGRTTAYTLVYNGSAISFTELTKASNGLTCVITDTGINVTGAEANQVYTVSYAGRLTNNEVITGTITVYTFAAVDKIYVFDFGLASDLAATNKNGDGLFQGGNFYNSHVSGENAILTSLTGNGNTQTSITAAFNGTIGTNGTYSSIMFRPVAFMSQVEVYTYTVQITASGMTFDPNNPETGTTVTGTIQVMPANSVYYEDNFNVIDGDNDPSKEIIYSNNGPTTAPSMNQSNDQSTNYGYDDAYLGGYGQSNGSAVTLSSGQYAYFTFSGTGFDLISETNGSSAGLAVYVFTGGHSEANLKYMTTFSGNRPSTMVFVDTYYHNGNLYQVPVVTVDLSSYGTYTVYVQALATSPKLTSVAIDAVRIHNPLADTSLYPLQAEKNTTVVELRVLYGIDGVVSLAGRGSNGVFSGLGKQSVVQDALKNASIIEDPNGKAIKSAADLENIYLHGPNNEMYLPKNFGISFSYTVNSVDWTLQLGAKAVTKTNASKSISVYARTSGTGSYTQVGTITLNSASDMYYDLTDLLSAFATEGKTYDIIIISNSDYASNEFVSLTTVKHSGITLS